MSVKSLRRKVEQDRKVAWTAALTLADRADDPSTAADLEFALDRVEQLDHRLERIPAIEVKEPDLYGRGQSHDFIADLVAASSPWPVRGVTPSAAAERLQRHSTYEAIRRHGDGSRQERKLSDRGIQSRGAGDGVQGRALTTLPGVGGEYVPPSWLLGEFASVVRSAAPLRAILPSLALPDSCLELVVPKIDSAAGMVPQTIENVSVTDIYDDPIASTSELVFPVRTVAGSALVSQQLIDRSNVSELLVRDLGESYAAALELGLVTGDGTNGQLLGLQSAAGVTNTWTTASPTPQGLVTQLGMLASTVALARLRAPSHLILNPSRYYWLSASPDGSTNTPMQRVGTGYPPMDPDSGGVVGPIAGLGTVLDSAIPRTVNTDQDVAFALRAQDLVVVEGEPQLSVVVAEGASSMSVSVVLHVYCTFVSNRYPSSIAVLSGTGLAIPAGW